ncbi:Na+/H+ antiporter NhaC [Kangiella sp. TOML190]|uniref:Na+/H+ antiporter NhaC n=1 Tax=Kangiella sp. TOML190 TaxID=2931351 RepID=UPI00203D7268|nr:Na+/H+ antiporter NhaC [Kangiella sp. TOML190]
MVDSQSRQPSIAQALLPILTLIGLLFLSVRLYGADSSYGANQIALIIAAAIAIIVGLVNGQTWKELEKGVVDGISLALGAMLILLMVGALIGAWILAGTVPTMIYYGLQILSPEYFYVASTVICAIVSISIGSSWTTAGTIGVSLIVIAESLGLSSAITAGAIISGAYFGDKMSPLSDTTNLAPAVTGTDLFVHIRHMIWTTLPSLIIAMVIFTVIGLRQQPSEAAVGLEEALKLLDENFTISLWSLVPLLAVFVMAFKKVPAVATILIGALLGGVFAVILQGELIKNFVDNDKLSTAMTYFAGVWSSLFSGFTIETGSEDFDKLLSRGGMSSMLNTIWLIICAMTFGAAMEKTGLLQKLVHSIIGMAKSTGSLVASVLLTCIGMNLIASDQYIAIVLPGRMYRAEFKRRGLDARNLSRTLEDAGTITSPLIPWNTCGAYMAGTLGVATGAYWIYCFFNLINPFISFLYGLFNFKITKMDDAKA